MADDRDDGGVSIKSGLLVILGGSVIVGLIGLGVGYVYTRGIDSFSQPASPKAPPPPPPPPVLPDAVYEKPAPTPAQQEALAGGQPATWKEQAITVTVPKSWTKTSNAPETFVYGSGGLSVVGTVAPVTYEGAVDSGLKSFYYGQQQKLKGGAFDDVRYMEIDGVKGVLWRESAPKQPTTVRRLNWIGYRLHGGATQSVAFILSGPAAEFAAAEDTLYAILYSADLQK